MSKFTQREAVFTAITKVTGKSEFSVAFEPSKEQRQAIQAMLAEGFKAGTIELADTPSNQEKLADKAKLNAYISGLISNWVRKDDRLNGGTKYVPENPGSRAGQGDEQLKTLRALKIQLIEAGQQAKAELVEAAIIKRVATVKSEKAAKTAKPVDLSKVDPQLLAALEIGQFERRAEHSALHLKLFGWGRHFHPFAGSGVFL